MGARRAGQPGVGPHAAAQLVLSWSHEGRITSEVAFARLAGVASIPAPRAKRIGYRLDRNGDRKLNRALLRVGQGQAHGTKAACHLSNRCRPVVLAVDPHANTSLLQAAR
jgi:transposase